MTTISMITEKDPHFLLQKREKNLEGYAYKLANNQYGMDTTFPDQMEVNESEMSAVIPFASGARKDGVGDLLEVEGIRTERHRKNPIILFDHGKMFPLPIAMAEDPKPKEYTVVIDPIAKIATAKAFYYQGNGISAIDKRKEYDHALFCEQLFHMTAKRFLRGGSIGYLVVKGLALQPDYATGTPQGVHLLIVHMLEASEVVLPANQDTVRKMLDMPTVCGKPLSPYLVKCLSPYDLGRKAQLGWEGREDLLKKYKKIPLTGQKNVTEGIAKKSMHVVGSQNRKSLEEKVPMVTQTKQMPPTAPVETPPDPNGTGDMQAEEQHNPNEPWGAQVLRRIHENAMILLEEYDEMMAPLENERVKAHLQKLLEGIVQDIDETEGTHSAEYAHLEPLGDSASNPRGKYQAKPGMENPEEENPEDVVAPNPEAPLENEEEAKEETEENPEGKPPFGKKKEEKKEEQVETDAVPADSKKKKEPTEDEAYEGMKTKELREKLIKKLRGTYKGVCQEKIPPYRRADGEVVEGYCRSSHKDLCPTCGKDPCICKKKDMDAPEEGMDGGEEKAFEMHEQSCIKEAHAFLKELAETRDFHDEHRMKAYHFHASLSPMGISDEGKVQTKEMEGVPPEGQPPPETPAPQHTTTPRRLVMGAAKYFHKLVGEKAFGDPHRVEALFHFKALEPLAGAEQEAHVQAGDPPTPPADPEQMKGIYEKQQKDISDLTEKISKLMACA